MEKVIEIINLTKMYKNNRGIKDISLTVEQGDIFGFLGPNGAGKTTAMKIMTGLMKPDSGDVLINGSSILNDYEKAMDGVGAIIEAVTPHDYMTAYDNMKLSKRYYKNIDDKRISECLEIVGIEKYKHEKAKNFSLGMRQRLGIAMALISNPKVLILDEPLNGMDVEGMVELRKLFIELSSTYKTTIFISSHLIHDVELTCNKVGILHNGVLLSVDSRENILNNYATLENYYLSEVDINDKN